ncbi:hypothetical protein Glove_87g102 [Diversispora epigaea]|uniref:Uncharacterized protein n=1 Tax=Diversispora epigaea TaxID=1348612 RepID=A0A397J644_9GLOM|nr:hypothetical protein Glove_87g102 [Diversispora epigaea]
MQTWFIDDMPSRCPFSAHHMFKKKYAFLCDVSRKISISQLEPCCHCDVPRKTSISQLDPCYLCDVPRKISISQSWCTTQDIYFTIGTIHVTWTKDDFEDFISQPVFTIAQEATDYCDDDYGVFSIMMNLIIARIKAMMIKAVMTTRLMTVNNSRICHKCSYTVEVLRYLGGICDIEHNTAGSHCFDESDCMRNKERTINTFKQSGLNEILNSLCMFQAPIEDITNNKDNSIWLLGKRYENNEENEPFMK